MKRNEVEKKRPAGKEEKKTLTFEEKTHVYTTGRNSVEVTVKLRKLKKDKDQKDEVKPTALAPASSDQSLRRGSWADLLSQPNRPVKTSSSKRISEPKTTKIEKQTRGRGTQSVNFDEGMQRENEFLRRQATTLLEDLNKAKSELNECFTTIKDLRQLSDLLKYENECLTESKNQRLKLEDHLKNTMAENRVLKKKIHEMNQAHTQVTTPKDNQIKMFKDAIKEMKSTIDGEIDVMRQTGNSAVGSSSLFQQFGIPNSNDDLLNDTKASEIQRILSSTSSMSLKEDEGSSTQYMGIPKSSPSGDINPVEVKRVLSHSDWATSRSSPPIRVSDLVKGYSAQSAERKDARGFGKGDCLNVEYQLKDSQGQLQLPIEIASCTSSEYLSSSSSTVTEHRNRRKNL